MPVEIESRGVAERHQPRLEQPAKQGDVAGLELDPFGLETTPSYGRH